MPVRSMTLTTYTEILEHFKQFQMPVRSMTLTTDMTQKVLNA